MKLHMEKILMKRCVWALALTLSLGGCAKEDTGGTTPDADGTTSVLLRPDPARKVVVRNLSGSVDENKVRTVWAIQLDKAGNVVTGSTGQKLIQQYPYADPDGKGQITDAADGLGGSITIRVDPQTARVCFIANTSTGFSDVTDLAGIESKIRAISNEESLMHTEGTSHYLPMAGSWTPQAGGSNEVTLSYAVAKLNLTLAFDPQTAGDAFALSCIQVKQVANTLQYFRDPATIESGTYPTLTSTTEYPAILYDGSGNSQTDWVDLAAEWGTQYMPTGDQACRGKIIDRTNAEVFTWYLPENARGKGTATKQWEKNAETAPSGQAAYCTYVEIKGFYLTDGLVEEVAYHIYLGGNNTDDFNLLRGRNYLLTATIKDKKLIDTRVDQYTPQNYLDYTDNDSPWFVVAAYNDGSVNWENPVAQPGWKVPSQKEMMLAWVYNSSKLFGNSICWMDEMIGTKRWSINMDIGEVLLNDGASSAQSFVLQAIKPYTGSGTYPYLQLNPRTDKKNIIVSRDEKGGVKAEYLRDPLTDPWNDTPVHHQGEAQNKVAAKFEVSKFATEESQWIRRSWDKAHVYCLSLTENGKGWRMPTQRELMLLYVINDQLPNDYKLRTGRGTDFNPDDNEDEHPDLGLHIYYWSGTNDHTVSEEALTAWSICFCTDTAEGAFPGKTEGYGKSNENFVRCVRDVTE